MKVGDKAKVIKDDRSKDIRLGKFFADRIGKVGTVTYVDQELVSLKFEDKQVIAYWHSEVEDANGD